MGGHVLIIPFPAQGHVAPLTKLAHMISDHGIKVTFVNSHFIHGKVVVALPPDEVVARSRSRVQLVSVPDGLDAGEKGRDIVNLTESITRVMPGHLKDLIDKVNSSNDEDKITFVIADVSLGRWPMEVAEKMGIQWVPFCPFGPQNLALALHIPKLIESRIINTTDGSPLNDELVRVSKEIPVLSCNRLPWICPDDVRLQETVFRMLFTGSQIRDFSKWLLCNSFYELESYSCELMPKILPIGPLLANNHLVNDTSRGVFDKCLSVRVSDTGTRGHVIAGEYPCFLAANFWHEDSICISWLNDQPAGSVIYVAFGNNAILTESQFNELELGLELVGRPFLWVVRTDGSAAEYPDGFIERVSNDHHGKIVSWAPQEKALAHPSVACFLSHCGWNSTMDGLSMGVPFLCWPFFGDQFLDQSYICDKWKVGLGLDPDENGFVSRHEIKKKFEILVSDEGIKANAEKLKEMARNSVSEGGSSYNNFKTFVEAIKH